MNVIYIGLRIEALKALYSLFGSGSIGVITQEDTRVDEFVSSHEALFCDCIYVPKNKTDALKQVHDYLHRHSPKMVLSAGFPYIIPESTLNLPIEFLNVHPHLLPKWPGGDVLRISHASGETQFGATLHHMIAEVDAGQIIAQYAFDGSGMSLGDIYDMTFSIAEPHAVISGLSQLGYPKNHE